MQLPERFQKFRVAVQVRLLHLVKSPQDVDRHQARKSLQRLLGGNDVRSDGPDELGVLDRPCCTETCQATLLDTELRERASRFNGAGSTGAVRSHRDAMNAILQLLEAGVEPIP